jgi:hypothetical protein
MFVEVNLTSRHGSTSATEVEFRVSTDPAVPGPTMVGDAVAMRNTAKTILKLKKEAHLLPFDEALAGAIRIRLERLE